MALERLRLPQNVAGDFFVDSTCIDCDLCRQIAPATFRQAGEQSVVCAQPETEEEVLSALKALITCPTASIGSSRSAKPALQAYPELIDENVFFCGFASEDSFGASSYLIVRPEGNVLVDSPRFAKPLVKRVEEMGGISTMFLTHRDDVADHEKWASHFEAARVIHRDDLGRLEGIERILDGTDEIRLAGDLLAVPTPGHTRGHMVLLHDRVLFSGDHVWWSDALGSLHASSNVCWYSWKEQTASMERLLEYEFEWVLPGHGRRVHLTAPVMREHLYRCLARMKSRPRRLA